MNENTLNKIYDETLFEAVICSICNKFVCFGRGDMGSNQFRCLPCVTKIMEIKEPKNGSQTYDKN